MKQFLILLLFCVLFSFSQQQDVLLLPPTQKPFSAKPNKVVFFVPKIHIEPKEYISLLTTLQQYTEKELNFWIAIPQFKNLIPQPSLLPLLLQKTKQLIIQQGGIINKTSNQDVFVAEHGDSNSVNFAVEMQCKALILFASYLSYNATKWNLLNYPLPVLTLSGELDGFTRITRIAMEFQDFLDFSKRKGSDLALQTKPVSIIYDMNHSQFTASLSLKGDFRANATVTTTQQRVASLSSAFIFWNENITVQQAKQIMQVFVQNTTKIVSPYLEAKKEDTMQSGLCNEIAEYIVLDTCYSDQIIVNNIIQNDEPTFMNQNATLQIGSIAEKRANITTVTRFAYAKNENDLTTFPNAPLELECKMKTKRSVMEALQWNCSDTFFEFKCQDINFQVFNDAGSRLSKRTGLLFYEKGFAIEFPPDVQVDNLEIWQNTTLQLTTIEKYDTFVIQAFGFLDTSVHHCKMLSTSQAMEIIFYDAIQRIR